MKNQHRLALCVFMACLFVCACGTAEREKEDKSKKTDMPTEKTEISTPTSALTDMLTATPTYTPRPTNTPTPSGPIKGEIQEGSIVSFGKYEQDNIEDNGKEPIRWIVLSVDDDKAFLLSEKILDGKPYHTDSKAQITWETSWIRKWLNEEFFEEAFSPEERNLIIETLIKPEENEFYIKEKETWDKVYLLTIREYYEYALKYERRPPQGDMYLLPLSDYAETKEGTWVGVMTRSLYKKEDSDTYGFACAYDTLNIVGFYDTDVFEGNEFDIAYPSGIQPAIWVKLK